MTAINLSRLHFPVTTLGPGRRIGIWLQGCSVRCPGCISMDTWTHGRGATTVAAVMTALRPWLGDAEGITVSGGEPFDQPKALRVLLTALRNESQVDVFVYSGHPFERIKEDVSAMYGLIDAVMSDPFEKRTPQTLALRGSDNQRLHLLTALGRKRFGAFDRVIATSDRRFDIMVDEDGSAWLAGIPGRDDFARLGDALAAAGHRAATSEDRRSPPRIGGRQRWN